MIDYHCPPAVVIQASDPDPFGLSPERAAVILERVMGAIRAKQARRADALARLLRRKLERARANEGLDFDADDASAVAWRRFIPIADDC